MKQDEAFRYYFTAENSGYNTVNTNIGFYLSKDNVLDASDQLLAKRSTSISPGDPLHNSYVQILGDSSLEEGYYYVISKIDVDNQLAELNHLPLTRIESNCCMI